MHTSHITGTPKKSELDPWFMAHGNGMQWQWRWFLRPVVSGLSCGCCPCVEQGTCGFAASSDYLLDMLCCSAGVLFGRPARLSLSWRRALTLAPASRAPWCSHHDPAALLLCGASFAAEVPSSCALVEFERETSELHATNTDDTLLDLLQHRQFEF